MRCVCSIKCVLPACAVSESMTDPTPVSRVVRACTLAVSQNSDVSATLSQYPDRVSCTECTETTPFASCEAYNYYVAQVSE